MNLRTVDVDRDLRERLTYKDSTFPLSLSKDAYKYFVNGAVNCHWHDALEFGIVLSGEVDYHINDTRFLLREGDGFFVNANAMHMSTCHSDVEDVVVFVLLFPSTLFTGNIDSTIYTNYFRPITGSLVQGFRIEDNEHGREMKAAIREMDSADPDEFGYELHALSILARLWYATVNYIAQADFDLQGQTPDRHYEQRAKLMLTYVHQHYSENITVQDIAESAGVSRTECFRCFRRATNKKPVEYINEYRLTQAARLLLETDASITGISTSCGFGSSSYFGKLFRETFGASPMQFRKGGVGGTFRGIHGG